MEKFYYFWKTKDWGSQWHLSKFTIDGVEFNCAEQFMMFSKAMFFGDTETAKKILAEPDPAKQKELGRSVTPFSPKEWDKNCEAIVYKGSMAKFMQNPHLLEKLLATDGYTLVEASPYDKIWGIGLGEEDPLAKDRSTWKGRNLLGEILTKVRVDILANKQQ